MKLAVFSDIQANLPALEAVIEEIEAWRPDLVLMAGDLVNRGPDSLGCLLRFHAGRTAAGWLPVAGNHEHWVLDCERRPPASPSEAAIRQFTDFAWHQVAPRADLLRDWPDHLCLQPDEVAGRADTGWVHMTHGTMRSNRDGLTARVTDEQLADGRLPSDTALFICGHTHRPLVRELNGTLIVNVGSAGSPFDGDVRGSWGRFTWQGGRWHGEVVRFDYDRDAARRDFQASGFLDQGPLARLVYMEWERATLLIGGWRDRYHDAVLAGELDLAWSVDEHLRSLGLSVGS